METCFETGRRFLMVIALRPVGVEIGAGSSVAQDESASCM